MKHLAAVDDAKGGGDGVPKETAEGERGDKGAESHAQGAGGEHKWAEGHGWREERGQGDGEDGVVLHPLGNAAKDAPGDVLFEELHAAFLGDDVAEIAAQGGSGGGRSDQEEEVSVLRGVEDDQDVGDAGDGQRNEGAVDDGDEEEADEAEGDEELNEVVVLMCRRRCERRNEVVGDDVNVAEQGGGNQDHAG